MRFLAFLLFFLTVPALQASDEKHFLVIVCCRNIEPFFTEVSGKLTNKTLDTIFSQSHKNFHVIVIDDASTDKTGKLLDRYQKQYKLYSKLKIIHNESRVYKLANLYSAINNYAQDSDIIIEIDGDGDYLLGNKVFEMLNNIYKSNAIWMTYGGTVMHPYVFDKLRTTEEIPTLVIEKNEFRTYYRKQPIWMALRTFYAALFKKIEKEDLMYNGAFFERASDAAIMLPLFEMSGEKFFHIKEDIYLYNTNTGANDYKEDPEMQTLMYNIIYGKRKYKKIRKLI